MASSLPPSSTPHQFSLLPNTPTISNSTIAIPRFLLRHYSTNHILSSALLLPRSSLLSPSNPNSRSVRCRATTPGPPSPPESDPPTGKGPTSSSGLPATLSKFQDNMQIFFAVLFWMSLFFWASSWDGRNNGRSNKGPRF